MKTCRQASTMQSCLLSGQLVDELPDLVHADFLIKIMALWGEVKNTPIKSCKHSPSQGKIPLIPSLAIVSREICSISMDYLAVAISLGAKKLMTDQLGVLGEWTSFGASEFQGRSEKWIQV